jgi:outer membrane murein-binding lipoprotein Lpp
MDRNRVGGANRVITGGIHVQDKLAGDDGRRPLSSDFSITVTLKTVVGIVVTALTLSGLYWANTAQISSIRTEMQAIRAKMERQESDIREMQMHVALLAEKHREQELDKK